MCELICGGERTVILAGKSSEMQIPENGARLGIKCFSTMRNKFGPFYCKGFTEDAVSPDSFTLRGIWCDGGDNENYSANKKQSRSACAQ